MPENEKDAGHGGLSLTGHNRYSGLGEGAREKEWRGRIRHSHHLERGRVLEASTNSWILEASANIFGGGTEKPPDASPAVDDGRRFFRSGGTKAA
jgi:hypothetical protein